MESNRNLNEEIDPKYGKPVGQLIVVSPKVGQAMIELAKTTPILVKLLQQIEQLEAELLTAKKQNADLKSGIQLYTKEEVMALLKCSHDQIERWVKQGKFTSTKLGKRFIRFSAGEITIY